MFYEQDWLMKQIQILVRFIAKTVFKKDTDEFSEIIEKSASGADILYKELLVFPSFQRYPSQQSNQQSYNIFPLISVLFSVLGWKYTIYMPSQK